MAVLNIKGTARTPSIGFDSQTGMLSIAGRSLPQDVVAFYKPVLVWVQAYAQQPSPSTELVLSFEYINVESLKLMLDIISPLKKMKQIKINWHYRDGDNAMKEMGEDLSELLGIPFEYKEGLKLSLGV